MLTLKGTKRLFSQSICLLLFNIAVHITFVHGSIAFFLYSRAVK